METPGEAFRVFQLTLGLPPVRGLEMANVCLLSRTLIQLQEIPQMAGNESLERPKGKVSGKNMVVWMRLRYFSANWRQIKLFHILTLGYRMTILSEDSGTFSD